MAGNNSCGSKSIRYGLMADNVRGIDAMLADGTRFRFGELPDNLGGDVPGRDRRSDPAPAGLWARGGRGDRRPLPHQLRRVGGYNIEALTPAARAAGRGNLARLLVGSEGTLAFSAALDLKLTPVKPRKVLGICQFPTFRKAMEASQHLVTLDPEAVELVDRTMIDLGRSIPMFRATIDQIADRRAGQPADRRIPWRRGCAAAARPRCARRDDGRSRPSRRRWCGRSSPASRPPSPRCGKPGSTS